VSTTTNAEMVRAPRSRRVLAGIVDAAVTGGAAWLWRRHVWRRAGWAAAVAPRGRWAPLARPAGGLLRDQLGTPGQHLLGLRTVDRRTGRRVQLWRSVVLLAVSAGGQAGLARLRPPPDTPEQERERERFVEEMQGLAERHPRGSPEFVDARNELFELDSSRLPNHLSALPAAIVLGIAVRRLRRHLAPTIEILARR
jgi:hypothetical protein